MNLTGSTAQIRRSVLETILRSTLLKDLIRMKMSTIHPDSGRKAVKTILGEDPEVFFGIAGGLPVLVNSALGALTELAVQLKDKYPPHLLKSFLASLLADIDWEAATECSQAWADLVKTLLQASPELKDQVVLTLLYKGPGIKAGAINSFSGFVNGITRDDPQAISRFLSEVFAKVDGQELGKAAATMANALLDQKWRLASWVFELIKGRMKKRLTAYGLRRTEKRTISR